MVGGGGRWRQREAMGRDGWASGGRTHLNIVGGAAVNKVHLVRNAAMEPQRGSILRIFRFQVVL